MRTPLLSMLACALLCACSPPKPPEEERRPEPKAQAAPTKSAVTDYADSYKARARAVEGQVRDAADQQRKDIDAATR